MDLVCPAGNLPSLRAAADYSSDTVYFAFRDDTDARHFAGLNFTPAVMGEGIDCAQES